jgi:hypothetical protein
MTDDSGYKPVIDLRVGDEIYLYGNRTVLDVKNCHESYGKDKVKLCTSDGTFYIYKFMLIAPKGLYE